jgi:hypothetical protein
MLKSYGIKSTQRNERIKEIAFLFDNKSYLKYSLDSNLEVILTKDMRDLTKVRKYEDSPFPLLSNLEIFGNTLGE